MVRHMSGRGATQVTMDLLRAHVDPRKRYHNEGSTLSLSNQRGTQGSNVGNHG